MPNAAGQMQLQDYVAELQVRGFSGFQSADLTAYVNRGYFNVARRGRWYWEETTDTFTLNPGSPSVLLWPAASGELPNFKSLDKLYVTTANNRKKLKICKRERFFDYYLPLDLTSASYQGEPSEYYIWDGQLWILSPPNQTRTFTAHYHQRVSALVNPTDVPITPVHLDEAIVLGALIRCHKRANEPTLAQMVQNDLEEFFDDMRTDEEELLEEEPDRVRPDNTWL